MRSYRKEQEALKQRLAGLERKILVGGENLLEKAEEQERLLGESASELEQRKRHQEKLREAITQKEACSRSLIFKNLIWTLNTKFSICLTQHVF